MCGIALQNKVLILLQAASADKQEIIVKSLVTVQMYFKSCQIKKPNGAHKISTLGILNAKLKQRSAS